MAVSEWQSRQAALIGEEKIRLLASSSVLVFGVGGVGSYAVEGLVRGGIGAITVVDGDVVAESNLNRQLIADTGTIGRRKTEAALERIARINPECRAKGLPVFAEEGNVREIIREAAPDFIVDAIDTVASKLAIVSAAAEAGIPMISSMGTGNKLDPRQLTIARLSETAVCPLARVMRRELRRRGITELTVLYSREEPRKTGERTPASISFVPSVGGLLIAGYVIRCLIGEEGRKQENPGR